MDIKNLKLQIIDRILATDEAALLKTVAKILDLPSSDPFLQETLPQKHLSNATQELQSSIDEIFDTEK